MLLLLWFLCASSWTVSLADSGQSVLLKYASGNNEDEVQGKAFLERHNVEASRICTHTTQANWDYATDINEKNKHKMLEQNLVNAAFAKIAWTNATTFAWTKFKDPLVKRQFKQLAVLGKAALKEDELRELDNLVAEMEDIYSTAKICPYSTEKKKDEEHVEAKATEKDEDKENVEGYKNCHLALEPELKRILKKSRNFDELLHVWKAYRDATGKKMRSHYIRYLELNNIAAGLNGFEDAGAMWREPYESSTFLTDLESLWKQILPFYEQLHAYTRRRLITKYGDDKIKEDGPIPAHLLGSMWAQSWENLPDLTTPYPRKPSVDVTSKMVEKNMSVHEIFKMSEEFFTSLGLEPMTPTFWEKSLTEKPKDREIVCHASAWDFCDGKDFRIKQCTEINMRDLIVTHHEMGHIQYFQQYAHQPSTFRTGANPGFHEAIGDVLALSVATPKHLLKVGLLDDVSEGLEGDLNYLYNMAAQKIAFMPSGYLIDLWRWQLFSGKTRVEDMNKAWWELRLKYQGLCPSVERSEADFDPGSKYHVPADVPYIRYFVSTVVQFQFYEALCKEAGHQGPLYQCDIYNSKEAGQLFSSIMKLGASRPWPEVMEIVTKGKTNKMDAEALLSYFRPLTQWLQEQNKNETLGWKSENPVLCP